MGHIEYPILPEYNLLQPRVPITPTLVFSDLKKDQEKAFFHILMIERFLILSAFLRYPGPFGPTNTLCYIEVLPGWVAG